MRNSYRASVRLPMSSAKVRSPQGSGVPVEIVLRLLMAQFHEFEEIHGT